MAPIKWNPLCKVFVPMTIWAQRRQKSSSPSEPDAPPEEREASSHHSPKHAYSKHQSGEEDFDEELHKILDDDSEDDSECHCHPLFRIRKWKGHPSLVSDSVCFRKARMLLIVVDTTVPSVTSRNNTPRSSFLRRCHGGSPTQTPHHASMERPFRSLRKAQDVSGPDRVNHSPQNLCKYLVFSNAFPGN